jgi:hypothetical protein
MPSDLRSNDIAETNQTNLFPVAQPRTKFNPRTRPIVMYIMVGSRLYFDD